MFRPAVLVDCDCERILHLQMIFCHSLTLEIFLCLAVCRSPLISIPKFHVGVTAPPSLLTDTAGEARDWGEHQRSPVHPIRGKDSGGH